MENSKETVRVGYDLVSRAYRRPDFDFEQSGYSKYLGWITRSIGPGIRVLDIGCGCGIPVAQQLVRKGCDVVGVDISNVQVDRARELVPEAEFICQDVTESHFERASFDLVVAFYSIIHIPVSEQCDLFRRISEWLKPGAQLLCSVGDEDAAGYVEKDWLGVPGGNMFWSHTTRATYVEWLEAADLGITREGALVDSGGSRHPVILARKLGP